MSARPRLVAALAALVAVSGVVVGTAPLPADARAASASISGRVTDPSGNPLMDVDVYAYDPATDSGRSATTRADGAYTVGGLNAGTYLVEFTDGGGTYDDELYDDAQRPEDATPVTLTAGGARTGIDAALRAWTPAPPSVTGGPTYACECGGNYVFDNPDYLDFLQQVATWTFSAHRQDPANTYVLTGSPALPVDAARVSHYATSDRGRISLQAGLLTAGTTYTLQVEERSGSSVVASSPTFTFTPQRVAAPTRLEIHDSTGRAMDVFGEAQDSFAAGETYTVHLTGSWAPDAVFWNALNYFGSEGLTLGQGGKASSSWTSFTIPEDYLGRDVLVELAGVAPGRLPLFFSTARVPVVDASGEPLDLALTPATVSGTPKAGSTLTAKGATSAANPDRTYQWLRNGAAISGATGATYRLRSADAGARVAVRVTGAKPGYATESVTSRTVAVAAYNSAKPTVSGTATVGRTLTGRRGAWVAPGYTYTFQWLRAGRAVSQSSGSTYKLTSADRGKAVSLRVTARRSGFPTVVVVSAARTVR